MLNKIIAFSIRNKLVVGMMMFALIGWGIYNIIRLPIDAVPDITNNQVLVITTSPSLGAADIERQITFPVEMATRNIPGIIEQRSFSRFGLSIITIVFNDKTDVYWARQQVSERLREVGAQIPQGIGTPTLGPVTTGLGEIFQYVVRPRKGYEGKYSPTELRTIQDWIIRRQLLGTPGIADVSSFGGNVKQYEVAVNADKLKSYQLTITDVFNALNNNNKNTGGAYIESGPTVLFIKTEGLVKNQADIENVLVKTLPDGTPVTVSDIATVQIGTAIRYGAMCYNDQGEVAGAIVMMLKGGNSSKVIKDVKDKIAAISKTLPEGVIIEPFLDRTKMVNSAIGTVKKNLVEGALIVLVILVLFLGNFRAGLLVASIIPLAMLFAISMMNLFGVSGNLMSLGALDFGLIVDGAVIIVEATMYHLHQKSRFKGQLAFTQTEMDNEVEGAASKLMNAAVFGQIIILIVYFPILSLEGIEGKMFRPMAETVAFAIIGAFILSLTYVPMMSSLVLSKKPVHTENFSDRMMVRIEKMYRPLLSKALQYRKTVLGISAGLFALAIAGLLHLGGEFIPTLEEGDFAVDTRVLTGSSLTTTIKTTQQAAHILLERFPEVEKVVTKIGSGEIPTDPMSMEASDMMVILKPKKKWQSAKNFDELAEKMSKAIEDVPGVTTGFQFPVQMRFNELMTGGRQDVICKLFGENLDTLSLFAGKIGAQIRSIDGAKDVYVESQTGLPQIEIDYNRQALSQFGLSVEEVNTIVQSAFAGAVSGQVYENERRFDMVVRLGSEGRKSLADIRNLLIPTRRGQQIPLQQVADVQIKDGPNQIQREDAHRRITVGFNVRGKDVQTVVKDLKDKINANLKLPAGYYLTYGGQFENLVAAKKRLGIAVPISLLLILIMLYFAFRSVVESLLIFTAIPLSAIGGVFALMLRGLPFSISAGVGFIALFGISVLNGLVLLSEFNQLEKGGMTDVLQRIREGTYNRLRPVLMTASVASLGFLPMALSTGAGAEVQRPLATVVIGGLISATLLTLLVLPVLYQVADRLKKRVIKSRQGGNPGMAMKMVLTGMIGLAALSRGMAQDRPITLQAAIDSAMLNNRSLQTEALRTKVLVETEKTAYDIPATSIQGEYGKINSVANDSRLTLTQSIAFPQVYRKQKELLQAHTYAGRVNESIARINLKKQVMITYCTMVSLMQKIMLLSRADSVYAAFLVRQNERFDAGEGNLLEKTNAETQRLQAADQLQQAEADLRTTQTYFSYLLNIGQMLLPSEPALRIPLVNLPDPISLEEYPAVQYQQLQQQIINKEIQFDKTKKWPLLDAGITNQSITGYQRVDAAERYYGPSRRFSSLIAGINIPLFHGALNARIRAGKARLLSARSAYEDTLAMERSSVQQLLLQYHKAEKTVHYYDQGVRTQSAILYKTAMDQYANGSINFLEWSYVVAQSIGMEAAGIDAVNERNRLVIEINSYSPDFLKK